MRVYDKENKRLIYIKERATSDFWDSHWDVTDFKQAIEGGKNDRLCLSTLHKYMPDKKGLILEGGCGLGTMVYCMHVHGYRCIGIDTAEKTIGRIKKRSLNLTSGLEMPVIYRSRKITSRGTGHLAL